MEAKETYFAGEMNAGNYWVGGTVYTRWMVSF